MGHHIFKELDDSFIEFILCDGTFHIMLRLWHHTLRGLGGMTGLAAELGGQ